MGEVLDLLLAVLLLSMAWGALYAPHPGAGVGLFIAFGMLMALIWARLGASDLAFAEAAIGAGLTGVLLLRASRSGSVVGNPTEGNASRWLSILFIGAVTALLTVLVFRGPEPAMEATARQPELVDQNLLASGVEHPVTAVLLNFRAWDTVLELMVLLVALIGARQMFGRVDDQIAPATEAERAWPPLLAWARMITPLLVLTGGFVLWRGSSAAGGAFQAGSMLAAAAVLLRLTGQLRPLRWSSWPVRALISIGALLFLSVAAAGQWFGQGWLHYPPGLSKMLIITVEAAATLSIAVTLTLLVAGDHHDFRHR